MANRKFLTFRPSTFCFSFYLPKFFIILSVLFQFPLCPQLLKSSLCPFPSAPYLSQFSPFLKTSVSSSISLCSLSLCLPLSVRGSGSRCLLAPRGTDLPLSVCTVGRWVVGTPSRPSIGIQSLSVLNQPPRKTVNQPATQASYCRALPSLYSQSVVSQSVRYYVRHSRLLGRMDGKAWRRQRQKDLGEMLSKHDQNVQWLWNQNRDAAI